MGQVVEQLREAGIDAEDYARGPLGRAAFTIGILRTRPAGKIKVWEGLADVRVSADKSHRQAVLHVREGNRVLVRRVSVPTVPHEEPDLIRKRALSRFLAVTGVSSRALRAGPSFRDVDWSRSKRSVQVTVSASLVKSHQTLLCGMDETYHFVAALPNRVLTVAGAHRALRPAYVDSTAIRQGEWFFVPVDKRLGAKLTRLAIRTPGRVFRRTWEDGSTHGGSQVMMLEGLLYATGFIWDTRVGHHRAQFLEGWHRVVRNREVTPTRSALAREPQRRYWD